MEGHPTRDPRRRSNLLIQQQQPQQNQQPQQPPQFDAYSFHQAPPPPSPPNHSDLALPPLNSNSNNSNGYGPPGQSGAQTPYGPPHAAMGHPNGPLRAGNGPPGYGGYDAAPPMWGMPPPGGAPGAGGGLGAMGPVGGPMLPGASGLPGMLPPPPPPPPPPPAAALPPPEHMHGMNPWLPPPPPQMHQLAMAMYAAAGPQGMMPPPMMGYAHHPPSNIPPHHAPQLSVSRGDEEALAYVLRQADACNGSRRVAIEEFAAKRNQPSLSWKDYYLDQFRRIEAIVNGSSLAVAPSPVPTPTIEPTGQTQNGTSAAQTKPAKRRPAAAKHQPQIKSEEPEIEEIIPPRRAKRKARSPSPSSLSSDAESDGSEPERISVPRKTMSGRVPKARAFVPAGPASASAATKAAKAPPQESGRPAKRQESTTKRVQADKQEAVSNTRYGFAPTRHRLPLLQSDIHIPAIPSRSPTPPNKAIPSATRKGVNMYTQEDKDYFVLFLLYELRRNPELTKAELCQKLGEKAPHHSAESWRNHWTSRHSIADNIMRLADEWLEEMETTGSDKEENRSSDVDASGSSASEVVKKPKARANGAVSTSYTKNDDAETPDEDEATGSEDPGSSSEEGELGLENRPLTKGDMQAMAHWVASMSAQEWKHLSHSGRWERMGKKYPARTAPAWQTHYRRRKKIIHELAQKYRRRERLRNEMAEE